MAAMPRRARPTAIGEWARDARKAAGYPSADKAAVAAEVPPNWLRLVEAGHIARPDADRIAALERLYGSVAPHEDVRPQTPDEERLAEIVVEAYERGLREGLRIGGGSGEPRR